MISAKEEALTSDFMFRPIHLNCKMMRACHQTSTWLKSIKSSHHRRYSSRTINIKVFLEKAQEKLTLQRWQRGGSFSISIGEIQRYNSKSIHRKQVSKLDRL